MPYSAHPNLVASVLCSLSLNRMRFGLLSSRLYPELVSPRADLQGRLAIVTGANSGIGFEVARALASMGAHIVLACRNKSKGEEARKKIIEGSGNPNVELEIIDLAQFASVRAFVERWQKRPRDTNRVDILVNNAGGLKKKSSGIVV